MAGRKISVKLLIDKEKNRVIFAESKKDFVDILLSFLTLPMGTIVRLLGKQSNVGCFDKLYESVENLDTEYLQTEACKTMLLRPISSAGIQCENLAIQVDDTNPRIVFHCKNSSATWNFLNKGCLLYSSVKNTGCKCGNKMDIEFNINKEEWDGNGVFVKQGVTFMISDDLRIMPVSMEAGNFMFKKLGVSRGAVFEEQIVDFGRDEVLDLLKCSLQSSTPLTDVFVRKSDLNYVAKLESQDKIQAHFKQEVEMEAGTISVKLFLRKPDKKVLYGEAGEEFVDLLFSLLVLPLGSILKYLSGNSNLGSIDNLYKSVENLDVNECIISEDHKVMLLSPKLAPYSGCANQLIQTTEMLATSHTFRRCADCFSVSFVDTPKCCYFKNIKTVVLNPTNPKNHDPSEKSGRGYVMGPIKYMVTDEMFIKPLSFISMMDAVHQLKNPMFDVEEKAVCIGELEAMALVRAALISKSALNSAFSPTKKKRFRHL